MVDLRQCTGKLVPNGFINGQQLIGLHVSSSISSTWIHDDVIKWKQFPRYWPFVRGIHRFPAQRPVARSSDVFFDLRLNKRLSKQSWGWWFETLSCPLWRHCNVIKFIRYDISSVDHCWNPWFPPKFKRHCYSSECRISLDFIYT